MSLLPQVNEQPETVLTEAVQEEEDGEEGEGANNNRNKKINVYRSPGGNIDYDVQRTPEEITQQLLTETVSSETDDEEHETDSVTDREEEADGHSNGHDNGEIRYEACYPPTMGKVLCRHHGSPHRGYIRTDPPNVRSWSDNILPDLLAQCPF